MTPPGPDNPSTPARDTPDNDEFGTTEEVGSGGYPEEEPGGTNPDGKGDEGRREQPQRDEG